MENGRKGESAINVPLHYITNWAFFIFSGLVESLYNVWYEQ